MPHLIEQGYSKTELGFALSGVAIAYGVSKFIMGSVSDRSNARTFMTAGLVLSALVMIIMGLVPAATASVSVMFLLLLANGWFQGMGWPPSGHQPVRATTSGRDIGPTRTTGFASRGLGQETGRLLHCHRPKTSSGTAVHRRHGAARDWP